MIKFWQSFKQELHDIHNEYKAQNKATRFGKYRVNKLLFKAFKDECKERDVNMTDVNIKAILEFLNEK